MITYVRPLIRIESSTGARPQFVVPIPMKRMGMEGEASHLCRFSEGSDPSFSKPFPPEFPPCLTALQRALTERRLSRRRE